MRIISWNVNGIRAAQRKGLQAYIERNQPDMLCLQETKAHINQLDRELLEIAPYRSYFAEGERKGYSGVAIYTKQIPRDIERDFNGRFGEEGRVLIAHYDAASLYCVYFPNGSASAERLRYKMEFYDACLQHMDALRAQGREILVVGDVNTAHNAIDLARPKENENTSGFLREERDWLDKVGEHDYIDVFRALYPETVAYTWWDMKTRAKSRDVGWRLDYFFASPGLAARAKDSGMQREEDASDHCPIYLDLEGDTL